MIIFDILKNLFKTKDNKLESEKHSSNSVCLSIDEWNRLYIDLAIENFDAKNLEDFGKMLYSLSGGLYETKILDSLVAMAQKNPKYAKDIQTILLSWSSMIMDSSEKNQYNIKQPLIRPSTVFKK